MSSFKKLEVLLKSTKNLFIRSGVYACLFSINSNSNQKGDSNFTIKEYTSFMQNG
jgi:hypothetical protein